VDAAIVVAFEDSFEFVREDSPFPMTRLKSLETRGGLAIGLAGMKPGQNDRDVFCVKVFKEYEREAWAYQYMEKLRGIVRRHGRNRL
jgi:hypothetical protein